MGLKDSAGAGYRRVGFGYDKQIKTLVDARLISNADRSVLSCYGAYGGKAGGPYSVSVLNESSQETKHPEMCDTVTVPSKDSVRIVTTGGGAGGSTEARN